MPAYIWGQGLWWGSFFCFVSLGGANTRARSSYSHAPRHSERLARTTQGTPLHPLCFAAFHRGARVFTSARAAIPPRLLPRFSFERE